MADLLEFELAITPATDGHRLAARPGFGLPGLPPRPLVLPFDPTMLPRRRRDAADWVKQAREQARLLRGSEALEQARTFGRALFVSLFSDAERQALRECRARLRAGEHLRLRLRLSPDLATLPWELLFSPDDDQFLALVPDLALSRTLDLPAAVLPPRPVAQLRMLVVLASPNDDPHYPDIRLDRELRRIEAALKRPMAQRRVVLDVIRGPGTLDQLRDHLRDPLNHPVHLLHVLAHGDLDDVSGEGVLIFEDADGLAEPVGAEVLRYEILRQHGQTRLVVLNACLGALPVGDDPLSSLGAALLYGGVPAVVAMQFELDAEAAAELARVFYADLAAGVAIDQALAEARRRLHARFRTRLDWLVPVLFMRAADATLFARQEQTATSADPPVAIEPVIQPAPLPPALPRDLRLLRAQARMRANRLDQALPLYEELAAQFTLAAEDQAHFDRCRAWAQEEHELDALAQAAAHLVAESDWETAADVLEQIAVRRADYVHASIDLAALQRQVQAARTLIDAGAHADAGEWQAVVALIEGLPVEVQDDDLRGLLEHARAELAAAEQRATAERARQAAAAQERALRERFSAVLAARRAGDYPAALDRLAAILDAQPADREALQLGAGFVSDAAVPLTERLRAGRLLGQHGDPRPGVCTLPQGLDDPYWSAELSERSYAIGTQRDPFNDKTFQPANLRLNAFRIGRYPVTVWQYRQFVDAGGYTQQQWWTQEGWQWRDESKRPYGWDEADWTAANQPVIGVSWYEALAFCKWLTTQVDLAPGCQIRLPSEAEWEVAAMWDVAAGAMRAWAPAEGELWQNVAEAEIGRTAPVGLFPPGISPCGALDMAGNVWEWCGSLWEGYPGRAHERPADYTPNKVGPAVRGGSWYTANIRSGWGARFRFGPARASSGVFGWSCARALANISSDF